MTRTTRLAPSPTGALHLGNARTFLLTWLIARQQHWRICLRIEDLDGPRVKAGADLQAIDDLLWLGIDWDAGPTDQRSRADVYAEAIQTIQRRDLIYPCVCTRKEIDSAASAPHADDGAAVYPGTCAGRFASIADARQKTGRDPALRFRMPAPPYRFVDGVAGPISIDTPLGDFVIAKADGTASYQLAVVVDDLAAGVTDVIRGDDLIDSTPRQIAVYHALGQAEHVPAYSHLPLLVGSDGRRLAKRHGDTRVSMFRDRGTDPRRLVAWLARISGIACEEAVTPQQLVGRFDAQRLPTGPVVVTDRDIAMLLS
jgi:glutamyl-tRNA synthetase